MGKIRTKLKKVNKTPPPKKKEIRTLGPMYLKIYIKTRKKPTIVTRQLTKSRDFLPNYLCEFYLWNQKMAKKLESVQIRDHFTNTNDIIIHSREDSVQV
jgi:hypothetical protein